MTKLKTVKLVQYNPDGTIKEPKPRPTAMLNTIAKISSQAQTVGRMWQNNQPNFVSANFSFRDFENEANQLEAILAEDNLNETQRNQSKLTLATIKTRLTNGIVMLRSYLKNEELLNSNFNLASEYIDLGFQYKVNKKNYQYYAFPANVEEQTDTIEKITTKMQEAGNPYANKDFGLAYWQALKVDFINSWQNSEMLRSQKSFLIKKKEDQSKKVKNMVLSLKMQIRAAYINNDADKMLRTFGYLKENF